jgi:hypothetical protein
LARSRDHLTGFETLIDHVYPTEARQPGLGQDGGIDLALENFAKTGLDIAQKLGGPHIRA